MDKYTCNFVCTYMQLDDDDLYRVQLLQAIGMDIAGSLAAAVDELYRDIGTHFARAIQEIRSEDSPFWRYTLLFGKNASDNDIFSILFSMDLFQYTHACICALQNQKVIDEANMQNLLRACRKPV